MERLTHKARYEAGYRANKNVHDWECVDKLGQLEDLEEQGKLLKLPCEIGHKVYMIYQFCGEGAWEIEEHKIRLEDLDKIGETVFLTKSAAEQKLKEMEDTQNANTIN